jgi:hypothetical protein
MLFKRECCIDVQGFPIDTSPSVIKEFVQNACVGVISSCVEGSHVFALFKEEQDTEVALDQISQLIFRENPLQATLLSLDLEMKVAGLFRLQEIKQESVPSVEEILKLVQGLSVDDRVKVSQIANVGISHAQAGAEGAGMQPLPGSSNPQPPTPLVSGSHPPTPSWFPPMGWIGQGQLRISAQFSGDKVKGDASFALWKQEVLGALALNQHSEAHIMQAIRRSLKGSAAEVLLHLASNVTVQALLKHMEDRFGNVLPVGRLLPIFFEATQEEGELAGTWAGRLEDIMAKIQESNPNMFPPPTDREVLKSKFWFGLKDRTIHEGLRYMMDKSNFDQILVAARVMELESTKKARVSQATEIESSYKKMFDRISGQLSALTSRFDELEKRQVASNDQNKGQVNDNRQQFSSYRQNSSKSQRSVAQQLPPMSVPSANQNSQWRSTGIAEMPTSSQQELGNSWASRPSMQNTIQANNPQRQRYRVGQSRQFQGICYKCRQPGHRQAECPLNG